MTLALVIDLKSVLPVCHLPGDTRKEMVHVLWQTDIFSGNGLHAHAHVPLLRRTISRRQQCQKLHLPRPVFLHGLCSTDVSRESPRYRSVSSCTTAEVVPYGDSWHRSTVKPGRRQRAAG